MKAPRSLTAGLVALLLSGLACTSEPAITPPPPTPAPTLDATLPWSADHRQRLDVLIAEHGSTSPGHDPASPPVAVFDWDNTVVENDIGDAMMLWALGHDVIPAPAGGDWSSTSRWLSPQAVAALEAACGEFPGGAPMSTSADQDCAAEIYEIYEFGATADGLPAFIEVGYDHHRLVPRYAWAAQIWAGTTSAEVEALTDRAIDQYLAAPRGSTQSLGAHDGLHAWIRIYDQTADLIATLQRAGFDVWVVSASPEPFVRPFARRLGIDADHVIGIRTVEDPDGRLTTRLRGCGPVADGDDTVMTYRAGKRCWINQQIFGVTGAAALHTAADPARRPLLAAGDADTDAEMLRDAAGLRLLIDRHKPEVSCRAQHDAGATWLVEPMFNAPLPPRTEPLPCSTSACSDGAGRPTPCLDEAGQPIPDQPSRGASAAPAGGEQAP